MGASARWGFFSPIKYVRGIGQLTLLLPSSETGASFSFSAAENNETAMTAPISRSGRSVTSVLTSPRRTSVVSLRCLLPSCSRSVATHTFNHHASAISSLPTNVDVSSKDFKENARQMGEVMAKMNDLHAKIESGGPARAREKHIARGKMLPREYVFLFLFLYFS